MPSSVIRFFRYLPAQRQLEIEFVSGKRYRYLDVPQELDVQMRSAFSKGEFFNSHIKDHYVFVRVPGAS